MKIVEKISSHAYRIQRPSNWDLKIHDVFHVDVLTKAHADSQQIEATFPEPPPINIPGEDYPEYLVEEILDEHIHRGRRQYFIKYQGYPSSENTWEDEDNCSNAKDKIKAFHDLRMRAPGGDTVRKRARGSKSKPEPTKKARHTSITSRPITRHVATRRTRG